MNYEYHLQKDFSAKDYEKQHIINATFDECKFDHSSFRYAKFENCTFLRCSMIGVRATDCSFVGSDFSQCNFLGAYLMGTKLDTRQIHTNCMNNAELDEPFCRLDVGTWTVTVGPEETCIGCKTRPNWFWLQADDWDIAELAPGAVAWWEAHGDLIKKVIGEIQ